MPYVAGKGITEVSRRYGLKPEEIVKLGSNENPYGPSPKVAGPCKTSLLRDTLSQRS